jgi:hypothetical protein
MLFSLSIFIGAYNETTMGFCILEFLAYALKLTPALKYYNSVYLSQARQFMRVRYLIDLVIIIPIFPFRLIDNEKNIDYLITISVLCFNELIVLFMARDMFKTRVTDPMDEIPESDIVYIDNQDNIAL